MLKPALAALVLVLLSHLPAHACPSFEPKYGTKYIIKATITPAMDGCDFSDASVSEELSNHSLKGANFTNAQIGTIRGSDMRGARFTKAHIERMEGTILDGADFTEATFQWELSGVSAKQARFHRTQFNGTTIENSDFTGADFTRAVFGYRYNGGREFVYGIRNSTFTGADFTDAAFRFQATPPTMENLTLADTNFTNAIAWWRGDTPYNEVGTIDPANPVYEEIRSRGGIVYAQDFAAILKDPQRLERFRAPYPRVINGMDVSGADLHRARGFFGNCNWKTYNCDMTRVNFSHTNLSGLTLYGPMNHADFTGANLTDTTLEGDLEGAIFDSATLHGTVITTDQPDMTLAGARFVDADIKNVTLTPLSHGADKIEGITVQQLDPRFVESAAKQVRLEHAARDLRRSMMERNFQILPTTLTLLLTLWLWRKDRLLSRQLTNASSAFRAAETLMYAVLSLSIYFHAATVYFKNVVVPSPEGFVYFFGVILGFMVCLAFSLLGLLCHTWRKDIPRRRLFGMKLLLCMMIAVHAVGTATYIP